MLNLSLIGPGVKLVRDRAEKRVQLLAQVLFPISHHVPEWSLEDYVLETKLSPPQSALRRSHPNPLCVCLHTRNSREPRRVLFLLSSQGLDGVIQLRSEGGPIADRK